MIRIKLKADHMYTDQGLSPNEKLIDESDFKESGKRKDKDPMSNISSSLPHSTTHNESNRSPSPASISVSRKSSFCSFFKSKDSNLNATDHSSKKRSSSATTPKSKLDKSPLPSPSKSSSRLVFSLFHKSSNNSSTKPDNKTQMSHSSHIESASGDYASQQQQQSTPTSLPGAKPRLRYYEPPVDPAGSTPFVHIPLHTPPEEKELYGSSKTRSKFEAKEQAKQDSIQTETPNNQKSTTTVIITDAVTSITSIKTSSHTEVQLRPKLAPTAQIEKMQSTDEVENNDGHEQRQVPVGSSNEEVEVDRDAGGSSSLWSVEVQRHSSQESQETVISSHVNSNEDVVSRNSEHSLKNGTIERATVHTTTATAIATATNIPMQHPLSAKGKHKRHLLFSTKIGSGSEEQIFSTQLSLSKTESQSSQLSEQASALGSPKSDEQIQTHAPPVQQKPEVPSQVMRRDQSTETVGTGGVVGRSRSKESRKSHDSGSEAARKRESMELMKRQDSIEPIKKRDSMEPIKKRESMESVKKQSSEESLRKNRDSGEIKSDSHASQPSYTSPVQSFKSQQTQHSSQHVHHRHSHRLPEASNKMDISSESERESDIDSAAIKRITRSMEDHESTGLVLQESFDDELPYVPTTLPEERRTVLQIVPVKERTQIELKTIPVERPRSTTPINPASLDNYCERKISESSESSALIRGEKLRISLPRKKPDPVKDKAQPQPKAITRRTSNLSNKSWTEFAEQNIQGTNVKQSSAPEKPQKPPPHPAFPPDADDDLDFPAPPALPPRKSLTQSKWIDFENIPEKRQAPKKITTLPSKDGEKNNHSTRTSQKVHYNYVAPEECQCECHEAKKDKETDSNKQSPAEPGQTPSEDSQPLLDDGGERNSMMR